ncbi:hypothetical protein H6G17_11300 [Chroococcidiopsis sp. FACHB-1243]|nr:hypothetical protein [Chroococcidiopsis sp. [FACHB-1243]]MBD2306099.1 hypothetical protein [Chroococcidiopsis sp. [FACHB-1243]]
MSSEQLSVIVGAGFDQKFIALVVNLFAKPAHTVISYQLSVEPVELVAR